jgi:hypothetical protein
MGHMTKQFPFILRVMQLLPGNITILFKPAMASYVKLQQVSLPDWKLWIAMLLS